MTFIGPFNPAQLHLINDLILCGQRHIAPEAFDKHRGELLDLFVQLVLRPELLLAYSQQLRAHRVGGGREGAEAAVDEQVDQALLRGDFPQLSAAQIVDVLLDLPWLTTLEEEINESVEGWWFEQLSAEGERLMKRHHIDAIGLSVDEVAGDPIELSGATAGSFRERPQNDPRPAGDLVRFAFETTRGQLVLPTAASQLCYGVAEQSVRIEIEKEAVKESSVPPGTFTLRFAVTPAPQFRDLEFYFLFPSSHAKDARSVFWLRVLVEVKTGVSQPSPPVPNELWDANAGQFSLGFRRD